MEEHESIILRGLYPKLRHANPDIRVEFVREGDWNLRMLYCGMLDRDAESERREVKRELRYLIAWGRRGGV